MSWDTCDPPICYLVKEQRLFIRPSEQMFLDLNSEKGEAAVVS